MVRVLHVRRWLDIDIVERLDVVQKSLWISGHFDAEN